MDEQINNLSDVGISPRKNKNKHLVKIGVLILLVVLAGYSALKLGLAYNTIEIKGNSQKPLLENVINILSLGQSVENEKLVPPEKNRTDILILGMRGEDDPDATNGGAFLTDTILIFSFDKTTKKSSVVSVPRDLYIQISDEMAKINEVYERSLSQKNWATFTKTIFSKITGIYIDNVVVFDFSSFKKIIDDLGGIDITLDKPFEEKTQWGFEFQLPAGLNHLDGQNALYYARSRYSSSDFDRSRRQQQIIMAIKNKIMQMNFLADPIKSFSILNTVRSEIKTDFNILDIKGLLDLAKEFDQSKSKEYVISSDNLVYQSFDNSIFILLPKGDNFDQIKKLFQDIIK